MPDLPTDDVGVVAYYNILDNGSVGIDVTDVLNLGNLGQYEQYENGIRGTYIAGADAIPDRAFNFRVKSDGWVVVWVDGSEQFYGTQSGGSENRDNILDFFFNWTESSGYGGGQYNGVVSDIVNTLDSSVNYSNNDLSVYCYSYPDATNFNTMSRSGNEITFSYTSNITRKYEALGGRGDGYDGFGNTSASFSGAENVTLVSGSGVYSVDLLNGGLTPNSGETYTISQNNISTYHTGTYILGVFEA